MMGVTDLLMLPITAGYTMFRKAITGRGVFITSSIKLVAT